MRLKRAIMLSVGNVDFIALSFGVLNLLRLASYFPQMVAVARDRHGATAISFSCWLIWVGANASTGVYAWVRLADASLALISVFNAVCCAIVVLLAAYKRISAPRAVLKIPSLITQNENDRVSEPNMPEARPTVVGPQMEPPGAGEQGKLSPLHL